MLRIITYFSFFAAMRCFDIELTGEEIATVDLFCLPWFLHFSGARIDAPKWSLAMTVPGVPVPVFNQRQQQVLNVAQVRILLRVSENLLQHWQEVAALWLVFTWQHEVLDYEVVQSVALFVFRWVRFSDIVAIEVCKFLRGLVFRSEVFGAWVMCFLE